MNRVAACARGAFAGLAACLALGAFTAEARAGDWAGSFRISSVATQESGVDKVTSAADDSGNFINVWTQIEPADVGIKLKVFSQVSRSDGTQGQIHQVYASSANFWIQSLDVSRGPDGTGHLVWVEEQSICTPDCSTTDFIRYQKLNEDGQPFDGLHTLIERANDEGSAADAARIETDSDGVTRIVWFDFDGVELEGRVAMVIVPSGGTPLAPFVLREGNDWSNVGGLDLESRGGRTQVVWAGEPEDDQVVESRLIDGSGAIQPESELLYTTTDSINFLQVEVDGTGKSTVAFLENGVEQTVFARQVDPNGAALGTNAIEISDPADSGTSLTFDGLAVAPDGTASLAWLQTQTPPGQPGIRTRSISPAGTTGPIIEAVPPSTGVHLGTPIIAAGPDGGLVAYLHLPVSGPENGVDSIRAIELAPNGTPTGPAKVLDTVADPIDTLGTENIVMSGSDASLAWRHARDEVSFYGEAFGSIWDGTSPEVTLWAPPEATVGQELLIAAQSADRNAVEFAWSVNGTPAAEDGAYLRHEFAIEGDATVRVEVTDTAGNETVEEAIVEVSAVAEPPEPPVPPNTLINARPAKSTKAKTATFRFISSVAGSKFECRLDKAGWSSCKSPKKLKKLKPGKHTFRVRATKGDLIDKTPASYGWTVKKPKKKK